MKGKFPLLTLLLFVFQATFSQVKGTVTDTLDQPLPYVNIYTEDGEIGTTTNEEGIYELKLTQPGTYKLVFQFLGYEPERKQITVKDFPYTLDVSLVSTTTSLDEVTVIAGENPANKIMRNAIAARQRNLEKIQKYTADFYSRGLWRVENVPEKILGQEIGDLDGSLDSTRSGIIYLSETISEISYRAPNDFKENITASKVSGNDNGFSLNSAQESNFNFYKNTVDINAKIVSPLADYAFNYYNYHLDGIFYTDTGQLINKIEVEPKRPKDNVFSGFIYIVEDLWQIYGVELQTTGEAIQVPLIEELDFTQNFKFSEENNFWIKISQTVDFSFAMFGITGDGRFTAVYSDYNFDPDFDNTFSSEVLSFAPAANKKDSLYWQKVRPVPLTAEEVEDYVRKDSIQDLRSSEKYLDSVDAVSNKFKIPDLLFGYSYSNSYQKEYFNISSPLLGVHFNTVQGYSPTVKISFRKNEDDLQGEYWRLFSEFNYGFSDERLRVSGGFQKKFNNISKPVLTVSGGVETAQINDTQPISEMINSISSLWFERNYLKLYERKFAEIAYEQEVLNGFGLYSSLAFEERSPLYNTTSQSFIDVDDRSYTSNNPLQPDNFGSAPFKEHNIFRLNLSGRFNFGQKYMSFPNAKYNIPSNKYPTLFITYEKGLGASIEQYNFDQIRAALRQNVELGNKGTFSYNIKGGTFFNSEGISFLDYKHFHGNQTRIGNGNYLNQFHLLPYYALSTSNNYFEAHMEQDFQGWILGKIPGINQLNYNLILGAHFLSTENNEPYSEYSVGLDNLGFGKYRLLRLDYVISNFGEQRNGAFIFGLKFLGILE
ncbi:DUF5686 and carboxypeptidase regulatory-like domain-containing protein [Salinimicrobium terrae]|uniref:DUF5686 and carboxypeptidase regulatory-like domain-containing protein n=1 Tax=Salinimicrobium terrae TaxID=470866 RepID=UPI000405CA4C|nr:DUF5686 and carboxypeptidase regulatory-like domain-containing protein [Salinimicrobium terrae]